MENGHFLNLRWQNEQRSSVRQNKPDSLILKSINFHMKQTLPVSQIKRSATATCEQRRPKQEEGKDQASDLISDFHAHGSRSSLWAIRLARN